MKTISIAWREVGIMFGAMALQYFLATLNIRACAQANYLWTLLSDAAIAANGFLITKKIVESKSKIGFAAYIVGGMVGSQVGIVITKLLYGQ